MTDLYDKKWNKQYEKLVEFKRKNGHCQVPQRCQEDVSLGMWVNTQSKDTIRLDRKVLLDELGFVWNVKAHQWHLQYGKLVEFKRKNGHCNVMARYQEDMSLGLWVNTQRRKDAKNEIRSDRKVLLDEIGFVWKVEDHRWHLQYGKLVEFKRKNGHCLVPKGYEEDVALGLWVGTQRGSHAQNKMRSDRQELLDEIGFVWRVGNYAPSWNTQYEKLVEFKRKHGNCLVPQRYQEDMSLGPWVDRQWQCHCKNTIRLDRKGLLDELGFVWGRVDKSAPWNKQYEKLVEFKRKHGNCLVPRGYQEDMSLGMWVGKQRQFHIKNKLPLHRKVLLDELGFVWGRVHNFPLWNRQFEKLVEYKRKNRHCNVPRGYQEDMALGMWVGKQRQFHIKNKLPLHRKVLLDGIGFAWEVDTVAARSSTMDVSYR
jgi:hypothetical protein